MSNIEILIADGHTARGLRVTGALESAGYRCDIVTQGAAALEVALAEHPRVVVAEADLELVDAAKLAEILRANPRTRDVRFLFLGADPEQPAPGGIGDARLAADAPSHAIEAAVASLLERQERVDIVDDRAETELEFAGALSELGAAELLRMLHVRQATGELSLDPDSEAVTAGAGRVRFVDGEVFSAEIGAIRGEKAVFRMLAWRTGGFDFVPGAVDGAAEITSPTRSLLAEGLRQLDEWNRLAPKLPPLESPVRLCVDRGELPQLVHPLTQEVLSLFEEYDRVGDIVDHCSGSDYQVLRTLHTLTERGIAEFGHARLAPPAGEEEGALFGEGQVRRLRSYVLSGLNREDAAPDAKLLVVPSSGESLGRFVAALSKLGGVEWTPDFDGVESPDRLGRLARIDVDGDFGIDLLHLPAIARCEPLAGFAAHGALGTLVLLDANVGESAARVAGFAESLTARPGARNFNIVMLGEGERMAPQALQENLSLIDQASLFLLPMADEKDARSLLRSLFARIVP